MLREPTIESFLDIGRNLSLRIKHFGDDWWRELEPLAAMFEDQRLHLKLGESFAPGFLVCAVGESLAVPGRHVERIWSQFPPRYQKAHPPTVLEIFAVSTDPWDTVPKYIELATYRFHGDGLEIVKSGNVPEQREAAFVAVDRWVRGVETGLIVPGEPVAFQPSSESVLSVGTIACPAIRRYNRLDKIASIEDEGNRLIIHIESEASRRNPVHIIASQELRGELNVGDTIEPEDGGVNFRWFVRKVHASDGAADDEIDTAADEREEEHFRCVE